MKKAVVVCILVALLACMFSSVSFATPQSPLDYWLICVGYEGKTWFLEASEPFVVGPADNPSGIRTINRIKFNASYKDVNDEWVAAGFLYSADMKLNTTGYIIESNHDIYIGDTDPPELYYDAYPPPFGDAEVVITSPIDLYQDNAIRWKFRYVLAINDVEGGFDTSKLSYVLEFYAGPLYEQVELVSVTYLKIQDELYILTEEDRVVNMKTFEFEPPASRGKARVICLYDDEVIATAEVRYHRYPGFVDEDGNGLDDRTGLPDHSNESEYELIIEMPQKPEDGDLLAWIQYIGELFGYVFEVIISALKDLAEVVVEGLRVILEIVEPMFSFVERFFASLPAPMSAAMIALVTLSVVLGILKLLRG